MASEDKYRWSREIEVDLINFTRPNRELWDSRHPDFRSKNLKRDIFKKIGKRLRAKWPDRASQFTAAKLQLKFLNLKSYYKKQKKVFTPVKWKHFERLSFLNTALRDDESNFDQSINDSCIDFESDSKDTIKETNDTENCNPKSEVISMPDCVFLPTTGSLVQQPSGPYTSQINTNSLQPFTSNFILASSPVSAATHAVNSPLVISVRDTFSQKGLTNNVLENSSGTFIQHGKENETSAKAQYVLKSKPSSSLQTHSVMGLSKADSTSENQQECSESTLKNDKIELSASTSTVLTSDAVRRLDRDVVFCQYILATLKSLPGSRKKENVKMEIMNLLADLEFDEEERQTATT